MSFQAKIVSMEADQVVLRFEDGQSLTIPASAIEGLSGVGQEVSMLAVALGGEQAGRERLAQDLLNQLLKA